MTTPGPKTIGARVRYLREVANISARRLDSLAGITQGHTSAIESSRASLVSARTLVAIGRVFDASLDWLAAGTGPLPSERRVRQAVKLAQSNIVAA